MVSSADAPTSKRASITNARMVGWLNSHTRRSQKSSPWSQRQKRMRQEKYGSSSNSINIRYIQKKANKNEANKKQRLGSQLSSNCAWLSKRVSSKKDKHEQRGGPNSAKKSEQGTNKIQIKTKAGNGPSQEYALLRWQNPPKR